MDLEGSLAEKQVRSSYVPPGLFALFDETSSVLGLQGLPLKGQGQTPGTTWITWVSNHGACSSGTRGKGVTDLTMRRVIHPLLRLESLTPDLSGCAAACTRSQCHDANI